jgi:hypothetical protein
MLSLLALVLAAVPKDVHVVAPPPGPVPRLVWKKPLSCVTLAPSEAIPSGRYRVQCDEATRTCLAAPDMVLYDGKETPEPLARTSYCGGDALLHRALAESWPFTLAVPETQPGWYRDERGRVMQVNFDLTRRVWFGGSWAPRGTSHTLDQNIAHPEVGVDVSWLDEDDETLHRLHLFELGAWLAGGVDTRLEGTLVRFDSSQRRRSPPVRLTTFLGTPRRHDLDLNLTWGGELVRLEALAGSSFLTVGELDLVLDIWHSRDLESFLRVRAGPAVEIDLPLKSTYLRPAVALEGDFTLDPEGFQHLRFSAAGEKLFFEPSVDGRPSSPARLRTRAAFELIVLAINDYPLTLFVDGRATWRDDLPSLRGWEVTGDAGLRFSFWAPARHHLEN